MIETINENIGMIGKLHGNIIASNNQDKTKESLQKFLDVSNKYILNLLLTLEGLETGTPCLERNVYMYSAIVNFFVCRYFVQGGCSYC